MIQFSRCSALLPSARRRPAIGWHTYIHIAMLRQTGTTHDRREEGNVQRRCSFTPFLYFFVRSLFGVSEAFVSELNLTFLRNATARIVLDGKNRHLLM